MESLLLQISPNQIDKLYNKAREIQTHHFLDDHVELNTCGRILDELLEKANPEDKKRLQRLDRWGIALLFGKYPKENRFFYVMLSQFRKLINKFDGEIQWCLASEEEIRNALRDDALLVNGKKVELIRVKKM